MSSSTEEFALDQVLEPILIVSCTVEFGVAPVVVPKFVNTSFENLVGTSRHTLTRFPFEWFTKEYSGIFVEMLAKCTVDGKKIETEIEMIRIRKSQLVTFAPHVPVMQSGSVVTRDVVCIFRDYMEARLKRLHYLEEVEDLLDIRAGCFEVEERDLIPLFYSKKSAQLAGSGNGGYALIGKRAIQDLGMDYGEVNSLREACLMTDSIRTSERSIANPQCKPSASELNSTSTSGLTFQTVFKFVGNSPRGFPRYIYAERDITQVRQMEQKVVEMEEQMEHLKYDCKLLQSFYDTSPAQMGMFEIVDNDEDLIVLWANPAASAFLSGGENDHILGERLSYFQWNQSTRRTFIQACIKSQNKHAAHREEISTEYRHTNHTICLSVWINQVAGSRYSFVCKDITDRKLLEEQLNRSKDDLELQVQARTRQLEEALLVKSRFLAIMSHEMRTPLSGITTMTTLLSEAQNITLDQRELLHIAQVCCEQLLVVVTDILDLTQMEENKFSLERTAVCLDQLLAESFAVVSSEAEKKNLELIHTIDSKLLPLTFLGDPRRLRQILVNLLANAVKFSFKGEIVASARLQDDNILCSVSDQGVGIPESSKSRLFEPFYQADSTTTRRFGGSGLGLSICKRLAELMGGKMWFESTEGVGSTFYFTIPVVPEREQAMDYINMVPYLNAMSAPRVLVIHSNLAAATAIQEKVAYTIGTPAIVVSSISEAAQYANNVQIIIVECNPNSSDFQSQVDFFKSNDNPLCLVLSYAQSIQHLKQIPELKEKSNLVFVKKPLSDHNLRQVLVQWFTGQAHRLGIDETAFHTVKQVPIAAMPPEIASAMSVLLVEDNTMNQRVIRKVLESIGIRKIQVADNGKVALDIVTKGTKFDVILMDIMMPLMNGLECTTHIREDKTIYQPMIVALTANAMDENKKKCLAAGMNYVLNKPIHKRELVDLFILITQNRKLVG